MSLVTATCRSLVSQRRLSLRLLRPSSPSTGSTPSRPLVQCRLSTQVPTLIAPVRAGRGLTTTARRTTTWESLGVSTPVLTRLRESFPHIETPTAAQEALLRALQGRQDVFLRDAMGRVKTFVLALAALHLLEKGERVMILVPTAQLVDTIQKYVDTLSPRYITALNHPDASIWLSTPKQALSKFDSRYRFSPTVIMIDEPETLLSPLPPRHLQPAAMRSHPFYKHPPPLVSLFDQLPATDSPLRTIWFGAELNGLLKRIVRQRGWAGRDALELDFGLDASKRSIVDIGSVIEAHPTAAAVKKIEHTSYLVDSSGGITPHDSLEDASPKPDLPPYRTGRPVIEQSLIDAIVRYQSEYPTPPGTTTLILPPEGYPIDLLSARFTEAAASAGHNLNIGELATPGASNAELSVVMTSRSSVPGLDIPSLARVILINGLDLAGLSPAQRTRGGVKRRLQFYDVVAGRMGRLGSVTHHSGGQVVAFVSDGSGEDVGLELIRQSHESLSASVP